MSDSFNDETNDPREEIYEVANSPANLARLAELAKARQAASGLIAPNSKFRTDIAEMRKLYNEKKYIEPARAVVPISTPAPCLPEFVNVQQAAKYLAVSVWAIRQLIVEGRITAKRIGKGFVMRRIDLDRVWQTAA